MVANIKNIKETKSLQEFLLEESIELNEGLKINKLSDKLKKLLNILEAKRFHLPGEAENTNYDKVIIYLKQLVKKVIKIEKEYMDGNITRRQAVEQLQTFKYKAIAVKEFLQKHKLLKKVDWKYLISLGLSLVWIPLVLTRSIDLMNMFFPHKLGVK
jgi:hypothetical protein